ncbi:MAG: hypothetical protein SNJ57_12030 [Cyanobacteriota bacterium]
MTRSPIQPTTPVPAAAPTTSTAQPAAANTPQPTSTTLRASNVTVQQQASPLKRQERDPRGTPDRYPCSLTFLNGPYEGQTIDLGLAVNTVSQNQSANWQDQTAKGIRAGVNFDGLSPRDFRLELEFWALSEDVFHLLENLATAQEIGNGERQPPFLLFQQGSAIIAPVVCTSISHTLSEPHAGRKGYRYGKSELQFKIVGGRDSEHALGKPLTATPLGDVRATQTRLEQQRQARRQTAQILLAPCIGQQGSEALVAMIDQGKLADSQAIAQLPPETLAQAAIAGLFPAEALSNETVAARVRAAIASEMAAREPGFGIFARQVAQGWLDGGNFAGITSAAVLEQAQALQSEFEAIANAVVNQSFGKVLEPGNTAGERLRQFGACGLRLRNSGSVDVRSPQDEARTLARLNEFVSQTQDDEALKQRFGITTDAEVKALRNGNPYQSRQQFIEHLSQGASVNGIAIWSRFESAPAEPPAESGSES